MIDRVVILEVILEAPLVFEGAKAQVAKSVMAYRVVDVVLEPIAVLEHADAEIAVVLVVWCLLDVIL
jgi:hypothetical protein